MTEEDVVRIYRPFDYLPIFRKYNVIEDASHVVYASGKHGKEYIVKDRLYAYPRMVSKLCQVIADKTLHLNIEAVIAPALGGIALSQWTAYHLSLLSTREVLATYAEKADDGKSFVIKRGYDRLLAGKTTLVVEDVLTTGGSVKKVVEAARHCGSYVVGVAALANRGAVTKEDAGSVPILLSLANITLPSWPSNQCQLCQDGVPINTEVGQGKEFLANKERNK